MLKEVLQAYNFTMTIKRQNTKKIVQQFNKHAIQKNVCCDIKTLRCSENEIKV